MLRAFLAQISVAALSVTCVACLLLAAQVSPKKHLLQRGHTTDWDEIPDGEQDQKEDHEVGQSRGYGGEDRTEFRHSFPWFNVLFRNPDDEFKAPQDGYLTGIAVEVAHNVLLASKDSIKRASLYHGHTLVLQGWGNLWIDKFEDPSVIDWANPKDDYPRGVVRLLTDVGPDFGLYSVTHDRYPYSTTTTTTTTTNTRWSRSGSRDGNQWPPPGKAPDGFPWFDFPDNHNAYTYRYAQMSNDKKLTHSCYVYTLAAPDHGEKTWFNASEKRKFSRWPVKMTTCALDSCRFKFDDSRGDYSGGKIKRKGWQCNTWQDVGAPIMCAHSHPEPMYYPTWSEQHERRYSQVSFLARPQKPFDNNVTCFEEINALRVADYYDKIVGAIDKYEKNSP